MHQEIIREPGRQRYFRNARSSGDESEWFLEVREMGRRVRCTKRLLQSPCGATISSSKLY